MGEGGVIYLDKVEFTRIVKAVLYPGRRAPFHCTAIGKVLMVFQPKSVRSKIITSTELTKYNKNMITEPKMLEDELLKIKQSGYAIDNGEHIEEVNPI